ncbi:hypothetical protein LDENG_00207430 [Lucifuga dentata]|nr:hypothetical protein LDENG_00207430 [Lucifuga dentata]
MSLSVLQCARLVHAVRLARARSTRARGAVAVFQHWFFLIGSDSEVKGFYLLLFCLGCCALRRSTGVSTDVEWGCRLLTLEGKAVHGSCCCESGTFQICSNPGVFIWDDLAGWPEGVQP